MISWSSVTAAGEDGESVASEAVLDAVTEVVDAFGLL